ncbi:TfoX/Sxy family protein [Planctomonas psychrotolerans]|uniref:TfoX/Sxy family protein n=1 Tax=Planctomonas psychrotolerans TaxID=2528712 RepID=UPI001238C0C6|nr:TfoX/Sxy family protein [Planctomonas psychrotolerans]
MTTQRPSPRDALAQRLRILLESQPNVREVRMFGGVSFLVDERMAVAAGRDGDLLVRTDPARYDHLIARGGQPAFMGKDRPMGNGWLTVPSALIEDEAELGYWLGVGIDSRNTVP